MSNINDDIKAAIDKNLPAQIGVVLQARLKKAEETESLNAELSKKLDFSNNEINRLNTELAKHQSMNQYLIKIMQQTDNDLYKRQKAKIELENDSLKRIVISGGFWFGIFIGLGYFLLQLASSDISWYRFLAVIFFLPLFFIIVGAFALC